MILAKNDEIRVIAPSQSMSLVNNSGYERAKSRLESMGYKVTFGKNVANTFHLGTANRYDRAQDFNEAFAERSVKLVIALSGGWSANEILDLIDWDMVKRNPKPLVGFSDITVLLNAIYAKTGQRGFLGPNFSTIGRMPEWQYTLSNFAAVMNGNNEPLVRSKRWGVAGLIRHQTKPWKVLNPGQVSELALGGNLGTFFLLQGTKYQPNFDQPFIFLLEDDDQSGKQTAKEFSRRFESLLQLPGFRQNLKGLVIGRFQPESRVFEKDIISIVNSKKLGDIPIVYNIDFGHTLPMLTLPIGGKVTISAKKTVGLRVE